MAFVNTKRLLSVLLLYLCFLSSSVFAVPQYELLDIDALLGVNGDLKNTGSHATVVNDQGHVAGHYTAQINGTSRTIDKGFIYRPNTGVEELSTTHNRNVRITDMNNKDQFIGKWINSQAETYFVHRSGWENLEEPLESVNKINDNGDVVGIMTKERGLLKNSLAIWKEDYTDRGSPRWRE